MATLAQRLTGGRFFYGWILVGVCGVSAFWGSGVTSDSFGVLLKPFSDELGINRTEAVMGITIAAISGGFVSPVLGPLVDRYGARFSMAISGAVAGVALILLSRIDAYWQFLLLFGVVLGACRPGIQMVAPGVVISNWFVRKRGRAITYTFIGQPLSKVILVPLVQAILTTAGWRAAWFALGIGIWLTQVGPALLTIRRRPEDMGLLVDGGPETGPIDPTARPHRSPDAEVSWTLGQAVRNPTLWLLTLAFSFSSISISSLFIHMFPYFTDQGVSTGEAAGAVGAFGMAIVVSRIFLWGIVLDRLAVRRALIVWGTAITTATLTMLLVHDTPTAYFAALCFGSAMGGAAPLGRLVWPEYYGRRAVGAIFGVVGTVEAVAAAGGPLIASVVFDLTGSYQTALQLYALGGAIGVLLFWLAKKPAPVLATSK